MQLPNFWKHGKGVGLKFWESHIIQQLRLYIDLGHILRSMPYLDLGIWNRYTHYPQFDSFSIKMERSSMYLPFNYPAWTPILHSKSIVYRSKSHSSPWFRT